MRGEAPSTPHAPPYSPFAVTRRVSLLSDCTPSAACRAGHRREPSRPCGPGDVRACFGAPSALRASGIAFAPATSLHQERGGGGGPAESLPQLENNGCAPAGRRQKGKGRQAGKKGERLRRKGRRTEEGRAPFEAACRSFIHSFFPCLGLLSGVGGGRKIGRREGPCVQPGFLQSIFSSFAEYFLIISIL